MDLNGPSWRLRHQRSSSSDRFLGVYSENPSAASAGEEFNEDDVFWTGDVSESSHQSSSFTTVASSSPTTPRRNHLKGFAQPESFGILAALPEDEAAPSIRQNSLFNHRASISSSSASSSRVIPVLPKPPQERIALPSSVVYHQSAPVNVPAMAMMRRNRRDFDDLSDEDQDDGEMLPPHEIVARSSAQAPMLACSVLEGVGRTLKGRDLRQVRNAVFRQTAMLGVQIHQDKLQSLWIVRIFRLELKLSHFPTNGDLTEEPTLLLGLYKKR